MRPHIAYRRIARTSALIARSSRCYAVPCRSACTTWSNFFLTLCKLSVSRRQSGLASRRLVSCSNARCDFRSTSVPHFLSLLVTFVRTRTYFARISSGRIKWFEKLLEYSIGTKKRVIPTTSSRNFKNPASLVAFTNMDGTTARHESSCRITLACLK